MRPGCETRGLALRRPSLDDVFLALTGHAAEEEDQPGKRRRGRRKARRDRREGVVMTTASPPSRHGIPACSPRPAGR